MKIKGKDIDYILLIAVGVGLVLCLHASFTIPEASLDVRVVMILIFVIYVMSFPRHIRQIQSYDQGKEAKD